MSSVYFAYCRAYVSGLSKCQREIARKGDTLGSLSSKPAWMNSLSNLTKLPNVSNLSPMKLKEKVEKLGKGDKSKKPEKLDDAKKG